MCIYFSIAVSFPVEFTNKLTATRQVDQECTFLAQDPIPKMILTEQLI